jgi:hypothetical protein
MRIGAQEAELRRRRQSLSGEHPEFVDTGSDPAIGAAFNMNAAKGKAHERSRGNGWGLTSNLYMTLLQRLTIIYQLNYLAAGHGKSSPGCILELAWATGAAIRDFLSMVDCGCRIPSIRAGFEGDV